MGNRPCNSPAWHIQGIGSEGPPELVERWAIPCLLDGMLTQGDAILFWLVKAARQHDQIWSNVAAEAPALAWLNGFGDDIVAEIHNPRHAAAVHPHLEPAPAPVNLRI